MGLKPILTKALILLGSRAQTYWITYSSNVLIRLETRALVNLFDMPMSFLLERREDVKFLQISIENSCLIEPNWHKWKIAFIRTSHEIQILPCDTPGCTQNTKWNICTGQLGVPLYFKSKQSCANKVSKQLSGILDKKHIWSWVLVLIFRNDRLKIRN